MKTNTLNHLATLLVAAAIFAGCSDDSTSPVANAGNTNPTVAPPRISHENGELPPVPIRGLCTLGGSTGAVCSDFGFVAALENGTWRELDTGQSVTMYDVWGLSVDDFYVVGGSGCALHWNGAAFTELHMGIATDLTDVWGSARDDVWMTSHSAIVHWDGSTATVYDASTIPGTGNFYAIAGSSASNVWVAGGSGDVLHWDGVSWTKVNTGLGNTNLYSVFVTNSDVFLGGMSGTLWHFDGTTWSSFAVPGATLADQFNDITGTGSNRVWALGRNQLIYYWDGSSWSDKSDPFFFSSYDILCGCAAGTTLVTGGYYLPGTTNLAFFDGTSWGPATPAAIDEKLYAVWCFDQDDAYAFGDDGTIVHRDASGWSLVNHGLTTQDLQGAWASSRSDVYAVGNVGTVMHFDGSAWSLIPTGLGTASLVDVSGSGPDDVWCLAPRELWHWDGSTWADRSNELPGVTGNSYAAIYVAPGGAVFAAGDLLAHYDGTTWTTIPVKVGSGGGYIQHIFGTSASNVWIGHSVGIVQYDGTDAELRWTNYSGDPFLMAGRNGNILGVQLGTLVQFAPDVPTAFALPSNFIHDAHTGADGVTYVVGDYGDIIRIE